MKKRIVSFLLVLIFSCGICLATDKDTVRQNEPQIEKGRPNIIFDSVGNLLSAPKKIILLNPHVDSHVVGSKTECYIKEFIAEHPEEMQDVKFRINQWAPFGELDRLTRNKRISFWLRIFPGIPVTLWTSLTGRLLGGDNYNPYTNTVSIYSDDPSIALHEACHARDFMSKEKGLEADAYAIGRIFAPVTLYQEYTASDEVIEYLRKKEDYETELKCYNILYPAYGTYVGSYSGLPYGNVAGAVAGHAVGAYKRYERRLWSDAITYGDICTDIENDPLAADLLRTEQEENDILYRALCN